MNKWIKKSIELANAPGYLDKLSDIYVMNVNPVRPLGKESEEKVRNAFSRKDTKKLISLLIEGEVFPVKDSYVGFLRAKKEAVNENPKTINRIGKRLYELGIDELIKEATRPKETNRQLGSSFKNWLPSLEYSMLDVDEFEKARGIVILDGGDKKLKKFAVDNLGCKLEKGIDILFKKGKKNVIGEAKFLTTPGGEQDRGFDDASSFINNNKGRAKRIAVLDGYMWLKTNSGLHNKIIKSNLDIFSALLLKDYIKSL